MSEKRDGKVLFEDGDVVITQADVDRAIAVGRERTGDEFANLLTAPAHKEPVRKKPRRSKKPATT